MSCNSLIYTVNTNTSNVIAGNIIPIGTVIRRYGKNIKMSGDGIILDGPGYYKIETNVVIQGVTTGNIAVDVMIDGEPLVGATGTFTTTATNDVVTVPVQGVYRIGCCDKPVTLQLRLRGNNANVLTTNIIVTKV